MSVYLEVEEEGGKKVVQYYSIGLESGYRDIGEGEIKVLMEYSGESRGFIAGVEARGL